MTRTTRQNDTAGQNLDQRSSRCEINGLSSAPFPLTPALSPGERENRLPFLWQSAACPFVESGITCLPLPKGEGRGEGKSGMSPREGPVVVCRNLRADFTSLLESESNAASDKGADEFGHLTFGLLSSFGIRH